VEDHTGQAAWVADTTFLGQLAPDLSSRNKRVRALVYIGATTVTCLLLADVPMDEIMSRTRPRHAVAAHRYPAALAAITGGG
jgi:hypothetical protein